MPVFLVCVSHDPKPTCEDRVRARSLPTESGRSTPLNQMADKSKKSVLDMSKFMDKEVRVKFMGGREVVGTLKGYDALLNLVLDDTREFLKDPDDPYRLLDETRNLGLTVGRGTSVMLVCPTEGFEEISNPFLQEGDEGGEEEG